jgi:hypothetical protein
MKIAYICLENRWALWGVELLGVPSDTPSLDMLTLWPGIVEQLAPKDG